MKRILGLDLGSRTCGIALSDTLGMIAHGVETYHFKPECYDKALNYIIAMVDREDIETIVLGLPKHMNGDLGERAQISIAFKEKLIQARPHLTVVLSDERLTTVVATRSLIEANVSRKKRKQVVDKMAAVQILQNYLDSH